MIPFRLGTTSYIIPDDILPNVRYLADMVDDIELVLFDVDDNMSNLPSKEIVAELVKIAREHELTYTVHMPLDLRLGAGGHEGRVSLNKTRKVIELIRPLRPWAYVLHLDGKDVDDRVAWVNQAVHKLESASVWVGAPQLLAVENLEGYPLDSNNPVLERVPVSLCVDVGHLWLDGHDPVPYLCRALPRTRVIHLHGIKTRDHQSLAHMSLEQLRSVLECLLQAGYTGVLTLEVFNEEDLIASQAALDRALREI